MPEVNPSSPSANYVRNAQVDDPGIPTLALALNAEQLCGDANLLSLTPWPTGNLLKAGVRLLKWHERKRCAFEVTLRVDVGWEAIGKVYAQDRPDVFQAMKAIRAAGFDDRAEYAIPKPLAYVPSSRLLLVEKVQGTYAKELFLKGDKHQQSHAAIRSARWLAQFHALPTIPGRVVGPKEVLSRSIKRCQQIAEGCPALAPKAQRLLEEIEEASAYLVDLPMTVSHGDFLPGHVVLREKQVIVIDWDSFMLSDPSRDVARFLLFGVQRLADKHLGSIHALDHVATQFLETYLALGRPEIPKNLGFYGAALRLQRAKRYIFKQVNRWQEKADALLDERFRALGK
jgi:aminoglycoside phosphotransferase (APT) family kinase protein